MKLNIKKYIATILIIWLAAEAISLALTTIYDKFFQLFNSAPMQYLSHDY